MDRNKNYEEEKYEDSMQYKRLHTELGFCPHPIGDYKTVICKDCKFRKKYDGPCKKQEIIDKYNLTIGPTCCVCEKFNDDKPLGLRDKPYGILENNEYCDLYEKEDDNK